jgi:mono/diheme cytochrome c family protein
VNTPWAATLVAALIVVQVAAADKPVDPQTGLVIDKGFAIVKQYCTACHSARLITQAGKTRAGWIDSIRWMQKTQGLWPLEPYENEILDYLSTNYDVPPAPAPLRPPVGPLSR